MAAVPEHGTGLEPFTPSVFLDLPPTPVADGAGEEEDDLPLPDNMVLPYISRMLMEEDIHDKFFYQYPDHPALLQAQQPFADILSDAAASHFSSDATTTTGTTSSGANSATASGSTTTFSLSPSYVDVPAFANAAWPHDPIVLIHRLTAGEDDNAFSLPGQGGGGVQSQQSADKLNMDMLNQAFLRGMEEATKFLPTNNTLLMDTSMEEGSKKKKAVDAHDLESETGRRSKLTVPEPEETGDTVDNMVTDGYALTLKKMESLSITMAKSSNARRKRRNEAVDLPALLTHCAQAVSMGDHLSATQLLAQIKQHSSPTGDANQRLACCFAEGLEARLAGTGSQLYKSLMAKRTPVTEFLKAYMFYLTVSCFDIMAFVFAHKTIKKAIAGKKRLHIVDYGVQYGCQWPNLLDGLAKREGGPPEVRMTCIDLPQPGFRPMAQIQETGRRLSDFARRRGLPFSFHGIAAKWETVSVDDLNIRDDEVLVVNSISKFETLMDEGVDINSPSPRDTVLSNIRKMRPHVFIQTVVNGLYSSPFFVTRFREALFYYSAIFDMLDATTPRDSVQRSVVERDLIGRCALNVVACEGFDRVERPETYKQWQVRNRLAGLRQLPLCPDIVKLLSQNVRDQYHKDFIVDVDHHWLLQGWKGRTLYAMSTWAADEALPES